MTQIAVTDIRLKRRTGAGAPTSLNPGEPAFGEGDGALYIGAHDGTPVAIPTRTTVDGLLSSHVPGTRQVNGHALSSDVTLDAADVGAEPALGNPSADGYVLSSTAAGLRSWVEPSTGGGGGGGSNVYHVPILYPVAGTAGYSTGFDTSSPTRYPGAQITSDGSADAYLYYDVPLPAGTYSIGIGYTKDSNRGIMHICADDTELLTIDAYSGGGLVNVLGERHDGISVSACSQIRIKMSTKNGSSSAYYCMITDLTFIRTGA